MDTIEDFDRKYKNCFFTLKNNKELPENTVVEFINFEGKNFCVFKSLNYGDIKILYKNIWDKINIFFPESGLYNYQNRFIYFLRHPARQFKRNPAYGNCIIEDPILYLININSKIIPSLEVLSEFLFPKYPPLDQALFLLQQEQALGIALSSRFGLTFSKKDNLFYVWFHDTIIGVLDHKNKVITIKAQTLKQEAMDFFKQERFFCI